MKLGDGTVIEGGLINLPAIFIVCIITGLTEEPRIGNHEQRAVILKVAVVLMFITLGWSHP
jgi:APA family basic amino acid/polyamine antiporter